MVLSQEGAARIKRLRLEKEFLVGLLALVSIILLFVFGWLMGVWGNLSKGMKYDLLFGFAGGVEVGSPVRVAGVKVGRVDKIQFLPENEFPGERVTLKVTITVAKRAAMAVREDSHFFVNMAGIIGERYIEVSPGSIESPLLKDGSVVKGVDPPRIDQLLSQGYGFFGKLQEFMEDNHKNLSEFVEHMQELLVEANKILKKNEGKKLGVLLGNLVDITTDMKKFSHTLSEQRAEKFFGQLTEMMDRAHKVDGQALREFLQQEGIRARIF